MVAIFEQLNPGACKTYLLGNDGNDVVMVDPVLDEVDRYMAMLAERGLQLVAILETHTHADHISGAAALQDRTGAAVHMHELAPATCVGSEARFAGGDRLGLAGIPFDVLHTPGHTRDSVTFVVPGAVLTGDALFLDDGGAGRDDLPGGDPAAHYDTLRKLLDLDEALIVHPAHEYRNRQPSSLKQQKTSNPHLVKAMTGSKGAFVDYITNLKLGPADWMHDVLQANYACSMDPAAAWIPADSSSCEVKGTMSLGANEQEVPAVTPRALRELLDEGDVVLLDVREPFELDEPLGALDGIVNVPVTRVAADLASLERYKDKHVVSICKMGGRSFTAGQILKQAGFRDVRYLEGGMIAWRNAFGSANA